MCYGTTRKICTAVVSRDHLYNTDLNCKRNGVQEKIKPKTMHSYDVFDTLIARRCIHPHTVSEAESRHVDEVRTLEASNNQLETLIAVANDL